MNENYEMESSLNEKKRISGKIVQTGYTPTKKKKQSTDSNTKKDREQKIQK